MFKKMVCAVALCVAIAPQMHAQEKVNNASSVKAKVIAVIKWSVKTVIYSILLERSVREMAHALNLDLNDTLRSGFEGYLVWNGRYNKDGMIGAQLLQGYAEDYKVNFASRVIVAGMFSLPVWYYACCGLKKQYDEVVYAIDGAFVENNTTEDIAA